MKKIQQYISIKKEEISDLIRSTDFSRAVLGGLAMTLPILIGIFFDLLPYCIPITTGVLLVSPNDTKGNFRLKLRGILISAVLTTLVVLIIGYAKTSVWALLPTIGILTFLISYPAIYGFRASLVSFSGLLAMVIGLSNLSEKLLVWESALLISLGGLWYLLFTYIYCLIFPKSQIEESLSHTLRLTARYLDIRKSLIDPECNRAEHLGKLIQLQTELTEAHETLREILFDRQSQIEQSDYKSTRVLVLIQLIEILELAVSNPVDYDNADRLFLELPGARKDFQELISNMSHQLFQIADDLSAGNQFSATDQRDEIISKIEKNIQNFEARHQNHLDDRLLTLKNFIKYQKQQSEKITEIQQLLQNSTLHKSKDINKLDLNRFVSRPSYDLNLIIENFNFNSAIFRHSLRITVVMLVGSIIGLIIDPSNYYWILMTIIVIMRPNYGLTKKRSKQRTIGTILGVIIALAIIFMVQNLIVYGILAAVSLVLAFAMLQRNYSTAAIFITLSVVFVYALLTPDVLNMIEFRMLDTAVGAALAVVGNILLWPAWEIKSIGNTMIETISAQRKYLEQIAVYYNEVGELTQEYKLSRKKAFLSISELNAAFRRMTQEPDYKNKNTEEIYELVLLNHSLLSASASLGTYTINNPTTPASANFNSIISFILQNLLMAETMLQNNEKFQINELSSDQVMALTFGNDLTKIVDINSDQMIEEAHLVLSQLKWMIEISMKIPSVIQKTENLFD